SKPFDELPHGDRRIKVASVQHLGSEPDHGVVSSPVMLSQVRDHGHESLPKISLIKKVESPLLHPLQMLPDGRGFHLFIPLAGASSIRTTAGSPALGAGLQIFGKLPDLLAFGVGRSENLEPVHGLFRELAQLFVRRHLRPLLLAPALELLAVCMLALVKTVAVGREL